MRPASDPNQSGLRGGVPQRPGWVTSSFLPTCAGGLPIVAWVMVMCACEKKKKLSSKSRPCRFGDRNATATGAQNSCTFQAVRHDHQFVARLLGLLKNFVNGILAPWVWQAAFSDSRRMEKKSGPTLSAASHTMRSLCGPRASGNPGGGSPGGGGGSRGGGGPGGGPPPLPPPPTHHFHTIFVHRILYRFWDGFTSNF